MRLYLLLVAGSILCCTGGHGTLLGGWETIKDLNDPYVQRAAQYAVSQLGLLTGETMTLARVVEGKVQVVAGLNYQLTLAVGRCAGKDKCSDHLELWRVTVWVKPHHPPEYKLTDIKQLPSSHKY